MKETAPKKTAVPEIDRGEETSPLPTDELEATCGGCGETLTLAYNPEAHADGTRLLFECPHTGCPSGGRLQDAELPAGDRDIVSSDSATGAS